MGEVSSPGYSRDNLEDVANRIATIFGYDNLDVQIRHGEGWSVQRVGRASVKLCIDPSSFSVGAMDAVGATRKQTPQDVPEFHMYGITHSLIDIENVLQSSAADRQVDESRQKPADYFWRIAGDTTTDLRLRHVPLLRSVMPDIYKSVYFCEDDLRALPKHMQLMTSWRISSVDPERPLVVNSAVKIAINRLKNTPINNAGDTVNSTLAKNELSYKERTAVIEKYVLPLFWNFLEQDIEEKEAKQAQKADASDKEEGDSQDSDPQGNKKSKQEPTNESDESGKGDTKQTTPEEGQERESPDSKETTPTNGSGESGESDTEQTTPEDRHERESPDNDETTDEDDVDSMTTQASNKGPAQTEDKKNGANGSTDWEALYDAYEKASLMTDVNDQVNKQSTPTDENAQDTKDDAFEMLGLVLPQNQNVISDTVSLTSGNEGEAIPHENVQKNKNAAPTSIPGTMAFELELPDIDAYRNVIHEYSDQILQIATVFESLAIPSVMYEAPRYGKVPHIRGRRLASRNLYQIINGDNTNSQPRIWLPVETKGQLDNYRFRAMDISLIVDTSPSMAGKSAEAAAACSVIVPEAISLAKDTIHSRDVHYEQPDVRMQVLLFSGETKIAVPLGYEQSMEDKSAAFATIRAAADHGYSNVVDSIKLTIETAKNNPTRPQILFVISDGDFHDDVEAAALVKEKPSNLYVYQLCLPLEDAMVMKHYDKDLNPNDYYEGSFVEGSNDPKDKIYVHKRVYLATRARLPRGSRYEQSNIMINSSNNKNYSAHAGKINGKDVWVYNGDQGRATVPLVASPLRLKDATMLPSAMSECIVDFNNSHSIQ